ncbi:MAG TPA: hypothetical protein VGN34_16000 [Ktedonobacteraceae bacterium]|jgi:hypothetical protein
MSNVPARASRPKTRQISEQQRSTERLQTVIKRASRREERTTEPVTINVIRRQGLSHRLLAFIVGMLIVLVVIGFWQTVVRSL